MEDLLDAALNSGVKVALSLSTGVKIALYQNSILEGKKLFWHNAEQTRYVSRLNPARPSCSALFSLSLSLFSLPAESERRKAFRQSWQ